MMIATETISLRAKLGGAVSTDNSPITGHYVTMSSTGVVTDVQAIHAITNGISPIEIVPVAAVGYVNVLKNLQVLNEDSKTTSVVLEQYDGTTSHKVSNSTLLPEQFMSLDCDGNITLSEVIAQPINSGIGWVALGACTYETADSPTFQFSVTADVTGFIGVGNRIKLTQTTEKYFIVTAVGAFTAGKTIISVYGGTDYVLTNAAISNAFFSIHKSPFGFPLNRDKWTVRVTDATQRTQNSPVLNTKYNLGGLQISLPIGLWELSSKAYVQSNGPAGNWVDIAMTLSTSATTESDTRLTSWHRVYAGAEAPAIGVTATIYPTSVAIVTKTFYFLNLWNWNVASSSISIGVNSNPTIIEAVCAYL